MVPIHPSIHLSIYLFIYLSIHPSIQQFIHLSIYPLSYTPRDLQDIPDRFLSTSGSAPHTIDLTSFPPPDGVYTTCPLPPQKGISSSSELQRQLPKRPLPPILFCSVHFHFPKQKVYKLSQRKPEN
ncbi:mCG148073 [Mus musculus]|uniref:Uncharacterized protein n=1 Tax=Mus musculus TaxID=10090 RepID=Q8C3B6_MOUSE|nr:mCG148073 [Mus musculus]BAC39662.1 unnamed protein product [Mus musculus]